MRIGIDIDDTITDMVTMMVKYADIYHVKELRRTKQKENIGYIKSRHYLNALYGWTNEEKMNFFKKYYEDILHECIVREDAKRVIKKLEKDGHEIYFITARLSNVEGCETEKITKEMLEKSGISYKELIIDASDKPKACNEKNIDIMIDDSYQTCQEMIKEHKVAILITSKLNEKIEVENNVFRAKDWYEIDAFIEQLSRK